MGALVSKFRELIKGFNREVRVLMLGLDAAGKTTILYKLKLNENTLNAPTIGFNVESIQYKKLKLTMWDVGGQTRIRRLWRHYYQGTDVLVFVVDANDSERFEEAREELHAVLGDDMMRDCALLVLANKADLPNARSPAEVADALHLNEFRGRKWCVKRSNAVTGEGLYEGFDWIAENTGRA